MFRFQLFFEAEFPLVETTELVDLVLVLSPNLYFFPSGRNLVLL